MTGERVEVHLNLIAEERLEARHSKEEEERVDQCHLITGGLTEKEVEADQHLPIGQGQHHTIGLIIKGEAEVDRHLVGIIIEGIEGEVEVHHATDHIEGGVGHVIDHIVGVVHQVDCLLLLKKKKKKK